MRIEARVLAVCLALCQLACSQSHAAECPNVRQQDFCRLAPKGFAYTDGCNGISCFGDGKNASTLMACQKADPESPPCQQLEAEIDNRLRRMREPAECPNLHLRSVCHDTPAGFAYNDGCNDVVCNGAQSRRVTGNRCPPPRNADRHEACMLAETNLIDSMRVTCPVNATEACADNADRPFFSFNNGCDTIRCRKSEPSVAASGDGKQNCPKASIDNIACHSALYAAAGRQECTCAGLSPEKVCSEAEKPGFVYDDGCNAIECLPGGGYGFVRGRPGRCKVASEASNCCRLATARLNARLRSRRHTVCHTPEEMCTTGNEGKRYYDGCNNCVCLERQVGQAACQMRGCPDFYGTDWAFRAECRRRGAGFRED